MILFGVDPGIVNTGWAAVKLNQNKEAQAINSGTIFTKASESFGKRILDIVNALKKLLYEYKPSLIGLEELFINKNPQSSIKLIQVRGAIIYAVHELELSLKEMSATFIKKNITTNGRADKSQIDYMVKAIIKNSDPKTSHESDAYAIAYSLISFL